MGKACIMQVVEEKYTQGFGGKARRKEATEKT
jgi:hypothetical protein